MPKKLPCPNPTCTHVFSADALKGATAIACPLCGKSYRFRGAEAGRSMPTPPPLSSVFPPVAPPVAVSHETETLAFPSDTRPVVAVRKRRTRRSWTWLRALLVFLVLGGTVAGVLYVYRQELLELLDGESPSLRASRKQGNFSLRVPSDWLADDELRERMRANVAVSLLKPRGHSALFYLDHHDRELEDPQLMSRGLNYLRSYFPQLEYEDPFNREKEEPAAQLDGQPAIHFVFSATTESNVPMRGQAYLFSRQGFSYWWFFWGPEDNYEGLQEKWRALRQGFKLHDERPGWKPRPRAVETFTGTGLPFQVRYGKEIWKVVPSPKDADPACELYLRGYEIEEDEQSGRRRVSDTLLSKTSEVMVLVLPEKPGIQSAAASALDHYKKRQSDLHPALKIEPYKGRGQAKPPKGAIELLDRFRVTYTEGDDRFLLLGVAALPKGVLAVTCECRWSRLEYWEPEFRTLLEAVALLEEAPAKEEAEKEEGP